MYNKQGFIDGQRIRASHLNHMEEGILDASNGYISIEQTSESTEDGGENVIKATRADGTSDSIVIRNGSKGSAGPKGDKGDPGDASLPKPIPYEYMPEGYPRSEFRSETVLEEQKITLADAGYGQYAANLPAFNIEHGKNYSVVYDGKTYVCAGIDIQTVMPDDPFAGYALGNLTIVGMDDSTPGSNNDAPFIVLCMPNDSQYTLVTFDTETVGDHTFAIYWEGEEVTQIAAKFLPNMYEPAVFYESGYALYWDSNFAKGVTAAEIRGLGYTQIMVAHGEHSWVNAVGVNDNGGTDVTVVTMGQDTSGNPLRNEYYPVDYPAPGN